MKKLKVDRIDSMYVICIDKDKKFFALDVNEAPKNIKKGDKLTIDDNGKVEILK